MRENKQDILRFEKEWKKLADIDKIERGVYVLGGNSASVYTSRNPIALLGFCIKKPDCLYRRKKDCDFLSDSCNDYQTKTICEILQEKNIPFYFVVDFEDIQCAIDDFHEKNKANSLDLCIALCCPRELTANKNDAHYFIEKYNAPLLAFLITNYGECKMNGKSSRQFDGQTEVDTDQLKRVLNMYFKRK
ncbi:hypothetical protein HYU07_02535 [Candidatus Woesearchaeota archaeon]|nr:hypothetical protein [Candidatus Woesearchaeota archaeon]